MANTCKVCSSNHYKKIGEIKNIWKEYKDVYQCDECSLYFIDSPTDEEINSLYKNEYHNNIKNKLFETAKSKMRYARSLSQFNYIKQTIDLKNKDICEIGAFDGLLLSLFKKNNNNVFGYELNDDARVYAKKKYDIDLKENFLESKSKYDIIILSHVIEHFREPKEILIKIKSMLKENGFIYIEVPNSPMLNECSYNMLMRYLNTEHIVNFNMYNLIKFAESADLKIVRSEYNNYNISIDNENLRISLLEGSLPNFSNYFAFSLFALKTLIVPNVTFTNYKNKANKWSYGENIRLIAKI
ncbi:class I SAM-dependent methyltransferase [Brachyspira pilosicoli]|uniref:Class I SAM-dependent methyltransferase n=1 Tax=Brachyspira pilosicoli TaxID=52584 RepID=A0AAJ6GFB7_BRAPL|nr:class I SAM-dependent methyltransferase [Brachyspira pilosicoli]WIH89393.1 class I SAM-dependent methyltransferase [Brachyspira pilosicoli]WIH91687.1 class I SAM-dependent methyltransferase [Brachyspira pilosicoli]WIH93915.1 class I SAM-dependent methyltransferase [Brachyspira pilosicoli]